MQTDYKISYVDYRGNEQEAHCSAFEDAERIAQFLADVHNCVVSLDDGAYTRKFQPTKAGS